MTNEEVMQLMTDMGLYEGGIDNWVFDNAWVMFANAVASAEREACAKVCDEHAKVYASLDQTPATKSAWAACIDNRDAIQAREKHDLDN